MPYIDESPTMSPQLSARGQESGDGVSPTPTDGLGTGVCAGGSGLCTGIGGSGGSGGSMLSDVCDALLLLSPGGLCPTAQPDFCWPWQSGSCGTAVQGMPCPWDTPCRCPAVPRRGQSQEGMGWPDSGVPARLCWKRAVPGVPSSGSPWGQGAAAPPGCRLHLVALGDKSPAGVGTQGAPRLALDNLDVTPAVRSASLGSTFGFPN